MSARELRAFLVAPLAAPVAYWAALMLCGLAGVGGMRSPRLETLPTMLQVVLMVGAPVAYAATIVGALPLYAVLRRRGLARHLPLLLLGALVGLATALLLAPRLRGEFLSVPMPPWAGVGLGVTAAEVFWRLLGWRGDTGRARPGERS